VVKFTKRLWVRGLPSITIIGAVRVANRRIDLVELKEHHGGGFEDYNEPTSYRCNYTVWVKVDALEDILKAESKPVRKGFLSWGIIDFKWEGNELAQVLNSDSDLKHYFLSQHRPPYMEIVPYRKHQCVRIRQKHFYDYTPWFPTYYTSPESAFPPIEAFEAYDRIAQHVRSIANVRP